MEKFRLGASLQLECNVSTVAKPVKLEALSDQLLSKSDPLQAVHSGAYFSMLKPRLMTHSDGPGLEYVTRASMPHHKSSLINAQCICPKKAVFRTTIQPTKTKFKV